MSVAGRHRHGRLGRGLWLAALLVFAAMSAVRGDDDFHEVYRTPDGFLADAFGGDLPEPKSLWITKKRLPAVKRIMGHDDGPRRFRYWGRDGRTAWILEEIGKVRPITTGYVVEDGGIVEVSVLIYRETRGWEVKHDFFTDQFRGARLAERYQLDRSIDGISGATLSVNALTRMAKLALYLHGQTKHGDT